MGYEIMPKAKKKKVGRKSEDANLAYPWLTNLQLKTIKDGGYFDKEGGLHDSDGCIRCTAIVQSTRKRCKNFAIPGELFCIYHGGTAARQAINKQRLYSAFIQDPILKTIYENGEEDEQIKGIGEELGLLRALLGKLLIEQGSMTLDVKDLKGIAGVIGEIRQLVDGCTKAQIKMGQLIELSKIGSVVKQIANIVQKYVSDERILEQIADEFDRLIIPATFASTPQPERRSPVRKVPALSGEIRD